VREKVRDEDRLSRGRPRRVDFRGKGSAHDNAGSCEVREEAKGVADWLVRVGSWVMAVVARIVWRKGPERLGRGESLGMTANTTAKAKCGGLSTARRTMEPSAAPVEMTSLSCAIPPIPAIELPVWMGHTLSSWDSKTPHLRGAFIIRGGVAEPSLRGSNPCANFRESEEVGATLA
jgi:hypothetical protein